MKNSIIILIVLIVIFGGVGGFFLIKKINNDKKIAEIKKGWYVEITNDVINVREESNTKSEIIGEVKKGNVYKVLNIYLDDQIYYWYQIEYKKEIGWIASPKDESWLKDVNNPNDIAVPQIKYYDDVYKVIRIEDINYKHLKIVEDKPNYTITHKVYHELDPYQGIDQYWILYTITDKANKSSSKLQKIEFEEKPNESLVTDYAEYLNSLKNS